MPRAGSFLPHARSDELVVTELDDEVLVYDKARDKAHCLNQSAALVWNYSNGKRTVSEIAAAMQNKLHSPVDEQIVWYALGQLEKDHLMEGHLPVPNELAGISRREFVKTMGKVAVAVTVPIVISLTAPRAALAASCLPNGSPCSSGTQCCSGFCGPALGSGRGPAVSGTCRLPA